MKLKFTLKALSGIVGLAQLVCADQPDRMIVVERAYDCWGETVRAYGKHKGTKVSDMDLITGLDPAFHKLTTISACTDMKTTLISGVTLTFA